MPDAVLLVLGAVIGAGLVLLLWGARRLAFGARELGSDEDRATYRTLHTARRAAADLRSSGATDTARAVKHVRALLGAHAVAIAGPDGEVVFDGPHAGLAEVAERIADQVASARRRQVFPRVDGVTGSAAVGAPIEVDGEVWGVVIAFGTAVRAPLVRATGEVAAWVSGQLELGRLDSSRAALAEAELTALRAQISPHFIYNALTAIASFITTDPARARELVLEFADFTRYSFRRHGEFTTLAEELRSIHSYLEIERARFGERLEVRLRISPETLSTVIPYLAVQPLVENAVKHGLEPGERGGRLTIGSVDLGSHTEITVEDDGAGMAPQRAKTLLESPDGGEHVGLRNVDRRLRQMYGPGGGLVVETAEDAGTMVRIRVPKSQPGHETG
ncbi:sensor histidine kinase [Microbacterium gorillae]|uniref:sensor histidine kinase n=1 Tax=Microbacterium gorillae TaxID=1231063 RepID=UPI00058D6911|nr:histidine kinase [Microbacterium gorillae]